MSTRARANGEGSIFPYRNGFAAYVWVTKPNGQRQRKYIYGKTREQVHEKWLKLQQRARQGPMATSVPKLGEFLAYWLDEVVRPNLAPPHTSITSYSSACISCRDLVLIGSIGSACGTSKHGSMRWPVLVNAARRARTPLIRRQSVDAAR